MKESNGNENIREKMKKQEREVGLIELEIRPGDADLQ